jgi:hypothetical protein
VEVIYEKYEAPGTDIGYTMPVFDSIAKRLTPAEERQEKPDSEAVRATSKARKARMHKENQAIEIFDQSSPDVSP